MLCYINYCILLIAINIITYPAYGIITYFIDLHAFHQLDGTQDIHKRNQRLIVYGLLGLGQGLTILVASLALALGSLNGAEKLHSALLYNVLRSPMSFFDTMPIGRLVNRFSKDIDTVDLAIPQTIRWWIMCFLQVGKPNVGLDKT